MWNMSLEYVHHWTDEYWIIKNQYIDIEWCQNYCNRVYVILVNAISVMSFSFTFVMCCAICLYIIMINELEIQPLEKHFVSYTVEFVWMFQKNFRNVYCFFYLIKGAYFTFLKNCSSITNMWWWTWHWMWDKFEKIANIRMCIPLVRQCLRFSIEYIVDDLFWKFDG